ncbi:BMP family lipoprotein [Ruania halotolerans]|uniref:BMP family lipoprotein n=1 Tax=Ruania halotolerans TaxID=2897773 RepID=UPI001E4C7BC8|nr:BMP family ABC transporter substrate-binding protein [Ruania halotolerans]UFU05613.1 BMP family ABC transporter substrate-binding protein [Ruania halotolerans]
MKKSIPAAIVAAAALTLTACGAAPEESGGNGDAGTDNSDFLACMISDEGGWDDASFNESGYNGLTQAESELGVEIRDAESTDPGQYASNADAMVQAGCSLTIGVGFALEDTIQEVAEANEDANFALVDSAFSDAEFNPVELENAKPLLFNTQEAAYLAGYLAAGMTETGTVATYGGQPFPSVTIFMDGFVDGVAAYNEAHGTDVQALGWDKEAQNGSMTGDFTNTENGYNTTQQFIADGADIILPVAGPVGGGSLRAASEHEGVSVIWVDSDGYEQPANADYQQLILTSVLKQIQTAVFDTIESSVNGEFSSEPYVGTLENGGVGLAPYHDFEDAVPAELQAEIEDLEAQIIAGDLEVTSPSSN